MGTIEDSVDKGIHNVEAQLKTWAAKLDEFVEQAEGSGELAKIESRQRIAELRERLTETQARFEELKQAERGKWDTFKADLHVALLDLEAAFAALARPPHEAKGR